MVGRIVTLTMLGLAFAASGIAATDPPTAAEATAFVAAAETELLAAWIGAERTAWVQTTYITEDTTLINAAAQQVKLATAARLAREAARFDGVAVTPVVARKLALLKTSMVLPAPAEPALAAELSELTARLESAYGAGRYCREDGTCFELEELEKILAESRNPAALEEAWRGWREVAAGWRDDYLRSVELANQGARELGYSDLGELWRSKYDMPPNAFAADLDRIWGQVRPLYEQLHCYVRARLAAHYGSELVPPEGPIPADLLGNMWAQDWQNIWDLVAPGDADPGYDLKALLEARGVDAREMVRIGERFFSSLGFEELPATFWQRSLFTKPRDRDVVCHASAWDIDWDNDLRLKMCIEVNADNFVTIHHELGHNYYQRAYNTLDPLFRDSANDGFHEAVGDTLALSMTPGYLVELGLLDEVPASDVVAAQLRLALDKIAFLPFGLFVDQYRFRLFSGDIPPDRATAEWWAMKQRYQGVAPPVARRDPADFDPAAKYHVAAYTPYTRYFLAAVLQFQFHRALCAAAGYDGPLHECSIYGSRAAGERLREMLEMGMSRPWQDALEAISGQREVDATAIVDYFAPLMAWLETQNAGRTCGWDAGRPEPR